MAPTPTPAFSSVDGEAAWAAPTARLIASPSMMDFLKDWIDWLFEPTRYFFGSYNFV